MVPGPGRGGVVRAVVLAVAVVTAVTPIDEALHDLVFRHVVSHEVRLIANGLTLLGTTEVALGASIALGMLAHRAADVALWRAAAGGVAGVLLGGLATQVVKHVACRARPRLVDGWGVGAPTPPGDPERRGFFHFPCLGDSRYHGFPSGHATAAFALAAALASWTPARRRGVWVAGAAGVAASRVVLNAHFLADVLGGALMGWWAGEVGVHLADRYVLPRWSPHRAPPAPVETPAG